MFQHPLCVMDDLKRRHRIGMRNLLRRKAQTEFRGFRPRSRQWLGPLSLTTNKPLYGSNVTMTTTNLASLASSQTAGWQSARVDNQTSVFALDFQLMVKLTTANTAPANDKAVYVQVVPWYTSDGGSTWFGTDGGTTTLPSGSEGTYTIALPNDLVPLDTLSYTTQNMTLQKSWILSNSFGQFMPHGWSLVIVNFSGAALGATVQVSYVPINETNG